MAARPAVGSAGVLLPGFDGTTLPGWLAERLRGGLAGVCLFGGNIVDAAQLRELTADIRRANPAALIAIDEEGGDVTRLYYASGSPYPGNALLGRIDDLELTESMARGIGAELRRAGVNLDFAPDIDINYNPDNPVIGVRSFGADAALVGRHAAAWVRGLESTGVAACAKHFPGHGDTAQDSHLALPVVDAPLEVLQARELVPFRHAIAAGTRAIMTSHIVLPRLDAGGPATFSARILTGLLRGELGFAGVIVSDALDMQGASGERGIADAAARAIAAGCDLLCLGKDTTDEQLAVIEEELERAAADGRLGAGRLGDAAARVAALAAELRAGEASIPVPEYAAEHGFDLARTAAAFDVREDVRIASSRAYLALESPASIAIGVAPWGLAAAGAEVASVREGEAIRLEPGVQPVLLGRDNHRHAWMRATIDDMRTRHPSTVVVDLGWPSDDRRYADVATFGASRHVGAALLRWFEEVAR